MTQIERTTTNPFGSQAAPSRIPPPESRLRTAMAADVQVVAPHGVLDRAASERLDDEMSMAISTPVALDLNDCTIGNPDLLKAWSPHRWSRKAADVCLVCARPTGRQVLARSGAASRFAIFHRVEDALQARILANSGFGTGWHTR